MFSNVFALSLGLGMNSALDTLCSQAYGAGNKLLLGLYLQRGLFLLSLLFIPILITNWFSATILISLGQPELISQKAGVFTRVLLLGIPPIWIYDMGKRVAQSAGVVKPLMYIGLASNLIYVLLVFLLLSTGYGYIGAAIGRTTSNILCLLMLLLYLRWAPWFKRCWPKFTRKAFAWRGCLRYCRLGGAGMFALCSEWWAFEILSILSGLVPDPEPSIGATAILLNCSLFTLMFYLGLSAATTVRVGTFLGAGDGEGARRAAKVGVVSAFFLGSLCALLLIVFRGTIPGLFVKDKDVAELVRESLVAIAAYQLVDAVSNTLSGVFQGAGRQQVVAFINIISYYVLGLPLSALLTFVFNLSMEKVETLWWGITFGLFVCSILKGLLIRRWEWAEMAEEITMQFEEDYRLNGSEVAETNANEEAKANP